MVSSFSPHMHLLRSYCHLDGLAASRRFSSFCGAGKISKNALSKFHSISSISQHPWRTLMGPFRVFQVLSVLKRYVARPTTFQYSQLHIPIVEYVCEFYAHRPLQKTGLSTLQTSFKYYEK